MSRAASSTSASPRSEAGTGRGLASAVFRGSALTFVGYGASIVLRLASNVVVTRLLVPEYFGLMALVNVILMGLAMFSDVGVGPSIIQHRRGDDPIFLNTAWTVQLIRGCLLWLGSVALAWPLAAFYGKPELIGLIPVAGLTGVLGGLESTRLFTLNRNLALGRLTLLELGSQAIGAAAMIGLAWTHPSVWALVAGSMASTLAKTVLSHTVLPGIPNRIAWDGDARKSLFGFGRWIFLSTAITYLSGQSDRLILGKLISTEQLGIYAIAAALASMPSQLINQLSSRVFYPAVARMMSSTERDPIRILQSRKRLLLLASPFIGLGVSLASPVASMLYDRRYGGVGGIATCLSVATWFNALAVSYGVVLLAAGRPKYISVGTGLKAVLFTALVWPVTRHFGTSGAALLMSLVEIAALGVCMAGSRALGIVTAGFDSAVTALTAAVSIAGMGLFSLVVALSGSRIGAVVTVLACGVVMAYFWIRKLRFV